MIPWHFEGVQFKTGYYWDTTSSTYNIITITSAGVFKYDLSSSAPFPTFKYFGTAQLSSD